MVDPFGKGVESRLQFYDLNTRPPPITSHAESEAFQTSITTDPDGTFSLSAEETGTLPDEIRILVTEEKEVVERGFFDQFQMISAENVGRDLTLQLSHELLFGPVSVLVGETDLRHGVLSTWRTVNPDNPLEMLISIEVTETAFGYGNTAHEIDTAPRRTGQTPPSRPESYREDNPLAGGGFVVTVPKCETRISYDDEDDFLVGAGIDTWYAPNEAELSRPAARGIQRWHPSRTNMPAFTVTGRDYEQVTDELENLQAMVNEGIVSLTGSVVTKAAAVASGPLGMLAGGLLTLGGILDPNQEQDPYQITGSQSLPEIDRNEKEPITAATNLGASSYIFQVPIMFDTDADPTVRIEANWTVSHSGRFAQFKREFSVTPPTEDETDAAPTGWPRTEFDAEHTRYNPSETELTSKTTEFWEFPQEVESPEWEVLAALTDTVYLLHYNLESQQNSIVAVNPFADEKWRYRVGESPSHNDRATIVDGTLYFGKRGGATTEGKIVALNTDNGNERWSTPLGTGPGFHVPEVTDGIVHVGSTTAVNDISHGKYIALDAESGERKWELKTPASEFLLTPAVSDDTICIGGLNTDSTDEGAFGEGAFHIIDRQSQTETWTFRTENQVTDAAVVGDHAYVRAFNINPGSGTVYRLNIPEQSAQTLMNSDTDSLSSPVITDERLYFSSGLWGSNSQSYVVALDPDDGTEDWRYETNAESLSDPLMIGDTLFCGGGTANADRGILFAIDSKSGDELWKIETEYYAGVRAVTRDLIYASSNQKIYAYR
ncbi:PQQ-binding-like beta-propeller repeat protein [Natrinema amylolyticum]|uniref:outer membrane protein assembly factor BamB family protein n=1 Tax=Natrinema amylolyticum TaxID=2878679 RepID=UPI001CFA8F9E|nr:PQQ-binding-like beta-propeller repeat protein [Natrinema amylolyticum]